MRTFFFPPGDSDICVKEDDATLPQSPDTPSNDSQNCDENKSWTLENSLNDLPQQSLTQEAWTGSDCLPLCYIASHSGRGENPARPHLDKVTCSYFSQCWATCERLQQLKNCKSQRAQTEGQFAGTCNSWTIEGTVGGSYRIWRCKKMFFFYKTEF